jgi:microcystin-dependent protein
MSDTINFEPGSEVGEIIIVDGKSWTWDGKKWILTDGSAAISDLPAKVDQLEQDIISLDEEIESIIPSLERGQWEYSESPNVNVEPREGSFYLVKNYTPGQDFALSTFTEQYKEATAVVFNNKQWSEDMSLAKEHQWDTVEVDEMIDLLDKPDPDGLFGKITEVDTDFFDNAVIIAFDKIETLGSPNNNNLSTLTRLKIFKEPTGDIPFFPVGVIMPYVGTSAPRGWLLCTGQNIPTEYVTLRSMVGSTTPNLRGRFLGGAGSSGMTLKSTYNQSTSAPSGLSLSSKSGGDHTHYFSDSGQVQSAGSHTHVMGTTGNVDGNKSGGRFWPGNTGSSTQPAGSHQHNFSVSGNTDKHNGHTHTIESSGWDTYTRPYTYAVNYIIKHD